MQKEVLIVLFACLFMFVGCFCFVCLFMRTLPSSSKVMKLTVRIVRFATLVYTLDARSSIFLDSHNFGVDKEEITDTAQVC